MIARLRHSRRTIVGLFVALPTLVVCPVSGDAQQPLRDARTAGRVEVLKVITLQFQGAAVAPNLQTQVILLPDGRWAATSRVFGGIIPLFTATGYPAGTLGHPGPGPGEFKDPSFAIRVAKQLWVVDPGNNRITAFGLDHVVTGDRTLPGRVIGAQPAGDGGGLLLSGSFFENATGVWHTTALVTMTPADDLFGGDAGNSHDPYVQHHISAETMLGEIWSVAQSGGDIQILRADNLEPLASSHLPKSLSEPERHAVRDIRTERPNPQLNGLMVDSSGVLWMVMGVADAHWRPRPDLDPHTPPPAQELLDTLILAVSTVDRAILGAVQLDRICMAIVDGLVSCVNEDAATIDISRLRFDPR